MVSWAVTRAVDRGLDWRKTYSIRNNWQHLPPLSLATFCLSNCQTRVILDMINRGDIDVNVDTFPLTPDYKCTMLHY